MRGLILYFDLQYVYFKQTSIPFILKSTKRTKLITFYHKTDTIFINLIIFARLYIIDGK